MKITPEIKEILKIFFLGAALTFLNLPEISYAEGITMQRTLKLNPQKDNPRNSEGDFVQLKDGNLLFVYTHFTGGADDHDKAYLAGRYSKDGGLTWTAEDVTIVSNEGKQNVMSVTLLRLKNGNIALFYLVKNSMDDCMPYMRISKDEAHTWSDAAPCIKDAPGYYVLNNDRVIQLESGRLLMPLALHKIPQWKDFDWKGTALCLLSDDNGANWRFSKDELKGFDEKEKRIAVHEPGVVELKEERVMMFCRTDAGCQYISCSHDKGESWTPLKPSNIISPLSPASIARIPKTKHLLLVWNEHKDIDASLKGKRTPLCAAISRDDGATWENHKTLEDNPHGWYCYTAIHFVGENALLAYCAGDRRENNGLAVTQVTLFPLKWMY
ncbi:exo-alpha-sialidase [Candidatus Sumerlaeota bacterium]|nr:exo-alpha-sialidase [Candidatus Sumerlaeota bacterium]